MAACYFGQRTQSNLVYSNAEEYQNDLNEECFRTCHIFVTLPSWIINNQEKCPKNVSYFVLNDFEAIPADRRLQILDIAKRSKAPFIITSKCYVEAMKQTMVDTSKPSKVFISMEYHYDVFNFISDIHESTLTSLDFIESQGLATVVFKLRKLLMSMGRKTVIVFRDMETAACVADILKSNYSLDIALNEKPKAKQLLICSDDRIMEIGVRTADHIVHFDLPDDFETFSLRYRVFEVSHCDLQSIASNDSGSKSMSSRILFMLVNEHNLPSDKRMLLLLLLNARGNTLNIQTKTKNKLLEYARKMNGNAPICIDIASHFTRIDHMLNCKYSHSLTERKAQRLRRLGWCSTCKVEILDISSPIYFTIRILESKNKYCVWCKQETESLKQFSESVNEFYTKSFKPVQNTAELNQTTLYVMRDGIQFWRCKILDAGIDNVRGEVRVKLVDLGKTRRPNIRDIGYLNERHTHFPIQTINLRLLELVPWNKRCWNDDDTRHVTDLIFESYSPKDKFGNGIFEITVEYELDPNEICATNLIHLNADTHKTEDYANLLISKGIATRTTDGFDEFKQHASNTKTLMKCI